ncbi:hypothetical protein OSB04_015404 [Centaurea solstitialis]|uniref:dihydrolipoyllysine-residue succinyltransferase n=1 Tax=Centaurea solstitialis TaxID=347529 RepID=A0AA38WIQ1_9ASTR|nr:hypothetical protein OSB04_015404 [Centaurea solstitialis]
MAEVGGGGGATAAGGGGKGSGGGGAAVGGGYHQYSDDRIKLKLAMFGVFRRKVVSGSSSASALNIILLCFVQIIGKSWRTTRPVASTTVTCFTSEGEVLLHPGITGSIRGICYVSQPGNLRRLREVMTSLQPCVSMQMQSRMFSSGSGDLVDAVVPFMGESISDGTLAAFLKKPGDRVEIDEPIAQVETDKVTIDVASPEAGIIQEFVAKEGDTVEPGTKVAIISKSAEGAAAAPPKKASSEEAASKPSPPPAAEKMEEKPKAKVEATPVIEKPKPASPPPSRTSASEPQLPPKERERRVPMTRLRKRVATRLKDSQNTFALLTTFNEVDMTNLMKLRSEYKDAFFEKHGVKLGLMSGFVKAAVSGLENQPIINAVIDGDDIIYRDYIDISIAVGTPKGLVVPVIRNAEKMNFADIEKEINSLAKKANNGTISIDEMAGGSFTISNGGVYGSLLSTPIINPPQSAILGMHSIVSRPMVVGGNIVPRPMMYIALTYDHRLIDGREAVFFLRRIKDVVEDPRRLLLDI